MMIDYGLLLKGFLILVTIYFFGKRLFQFLTTKVDKSCPEEKIETKNNSLKPKRSQKVKIKKVVVTWTSQAVPHLSTNQA